MPTIFRIHHFPRIARETVSAELIECFGIAGLPSLAIPSIRENQLLRSRQTQVNQGGIWLITTARKPCVVRDGCIDHVKRGPAVKERFVGLKRNLEKERS